MESVTKNNHRQAHAMSIISTAAVQFYDILKLQLPFQCIIIVIKVPLKK